MTRDSIRAMVLVRKEKKKRFVIPVQQITVSDHINVPIFLSKDVEHNLMTLLSNRSFGKVTNYPVSLEEIQQHSKEIIYSQEYDQSTNRMQIFLSGNYSLKLK